MKILEIPKVHQAVDACLEEIILENLPILKKIKKFLISSGGKRVRPLLHYYFCQLLGYTGKQWVDIASVSELIHAASLLHDDVVDEASLRRGKPTVGSQFGNKTAILAGDYLLACGIERLNTLNIPPLMDLYSQVLRDLSVSELMQMEWERTPKITLDIYDQIIFGKTASLFGACTKSAGLLLGINSKQLGSLHDFGVRLGKLFQKKDDCLDYFTSQKESGKEFLKDFNNGLFTYPVLALRKLSGKKVSSQVNDLLLKETKSNSDKETILHLMKEFRVEAFLQEEFYQEKMSLISYLDEFADSPAKKTITEQIHRFA